MAVSIDEITLRLKKTFPQADIQLKDLVGDQNHYELVIFDEVFEKKTLIEQHRLVHEGLGDFMEHRLHALTIRCFGKK
jgi:stress-induced morphogen